MTSAFAGVANENANPKTMTTAKRIAATFFVANTLLIVNFDFLHPAGFEKPAGPYTTPFRRGVVYVCVPSTK